MARFPKCLSGLLLLAASTGVANASPSSTFSSEIDIGSSLFTEQLSGTGTFCAGDPSPCSWNLGYSYKKATSSSPGAIDIVDYTNDFNAGLGWLGASGWGSGLAAEYSRTAAESLEARGASVNLSRHWSGTEAKGGFASSFGLTLTAGTSNSVQTFTGTIPRNKRITVSLSGSNELRESYGALDASWQPVSDWDFAFGLKFFGFNRNVADFLGFLDSPLAVQRGMSGFAGTVSGIPSATYSASAGWSFADDAKVTLGETVSSIVVSGQTEFDTRITIDGDFTKSLRGTIGYEFDMSPSTTIRNIILGLAWTL